MGSNAQGSGRRRFWIGFVLTVVGAFLAFGPPAAAAVEDDGVWHGNGYDEGTCESFEDDNPVDPGPGERVWHFVLNHVDDGIDFTLYFGGAEVYTAQGSQSGGGAYHFYVVTPADADPTGTYVDPADGHLVISHCEDGTTTTSEDTTTTSEETTTTTEETTTTTEATTTTESVSATTVESATTAVASEVLDDGVVRQQPEVLDQTVSRALPTTGASSDHLAALGIAMMMLGAVIVGASRRTLLRRD